jgi:hypothetical protein
MATTPTDPGDRVTRVSPALSSLQQPCPVGAVAAVTDIGTVKPEDDQKNETAEKQPVGRTATHLANGHAGLTACYQNLRSASQVTIVS